MAPPSRDKVSDVSRHHRAERVGFEPTDPGGSAVFKTAAFVHSATAPKNPLSQRRDGNSCHVRGAEGDIFVDECGPGSSRGVSPSRPAAEVGAPPHSASVNSSGSLLTSTPRRYSSRRRSYVAQRPDRLRPLGQHHRGTVDLRLNVVAVHPIRGPKLARRTRMCLQAHVCPSPLRTQPKVRPGTQPWCPWPLTRNRPPTRRPRGGIVKNNR
jgi:hypothetical protein